MFLYHWPIYLVLKFVEGTYMLE